MEKQGERRNECPSPPWGPAEESACLALVHLALAEDLGDVGDATSLAVIGTAVEAKTAFIARAPGVVAGTRAVALAFHEIDDRLELAFAVADGRFVREGKRLGLVSGRLQSILAGERTALNFLQRLSGVATQTRRFVDAVAGLPCRILDTRKTTPGWRRLEKYAVRCGGGTNHRLGLFDAILIKDNHLAALADISDPIGHAVRAARRAAAGRSVEVEVASLEQLEQALAARPDRILLDNMKPDQLAEAVQRRNALAPRIPLEASGGVTLANVRQVAETGVDFISVGALTHSAPALDLALDFERLTGHA